MDWFSSPSVFWLSLAAIALIIELFTGTLYLLFLSAAMAITAALTFVFAINTSAQWLCFSCGAFLSILLWQYRFKTQKPSSENGLNTSFSRLIGKEAVVITSFVHGRGRVSVEGSEWSARTLDHTNPTVSSTVCIDAVEDLVLIVRSPE